MSWSARAGVVVATALAVLVTPLGSADACAGGHLRMALAAFPPEAASRPLYWAPEDAPGGIAATILVTNHQCAGEAGTVNYAMSHGSDSTADYAPPTFGQVAINDSVGHPDYYGVTLDPIDDVAPETLEVGTLSLVAATGGQVRAPASAAIILVDTDHALPQVSLADGAYRQSESIPNGGVPVFRGGPTTASVQVNYSVSPTGSTPASDGDLSSPTSGAITIPAGKRSAIIPVTVVNDELKEADETLRVTISGGAEVTGTTAVTFTILDNEETARPWSTLHHPNNRKKYRADDYRIREIHVFTEDAGGAGVVAAEFALRRKMRGRRCQWWNGGRFKKGGCDDERWLKTGKFAPDYFYYRLRALKPTKGKIKAYTAFSRAIDGSSNVEVALEKGRNANTFKVKRPKKKK